MAEQAVAQDSKQYHFTQDQRDTLNAAERILVELLVPDETLMFSLHHGWERMSVTYFSPNKVQHGSLWQTGSENLLSDKMQYALEIRADEAGRADQIKAERVQRLRDELANLTEQVAE